MPGEQQNKIRQVSHNLSYTPDTKKGENYVALKNWKFSQVSLLINDKTMGNVLKLHQDRVRVYIRKNVFTKGMSSFGTGCPGMFIHPCKHSTDIQMGHLGTD